MERPEPGIIRWSPNVSNDSFIHINLQHRVIQVYEPTGFARKGRFDYKKLSKHDDFPPLTTYDWSPTIPSLVAVGNQNGVVNLLRVDDDSNAYLELPLRLARTCQAVAFSTANHLAVGLDRVRNDRCLQIWDVNRLSQLDSSSHGFPHEVGSFTDPTDLRESTCSVSSIKFFEDNPSVLVVGIRGQGLRIHDLRDTSQSVVSFQTKCNNNLAVDYADQNYFASSALDLPGVMVWDRRATGRPVASPGYLDAIDVDDVPWGGALRLDRAVDKETDPTSSDKNSMIRSLRYCRDHRGMLAVLSRSGQVKIFETITETNDSGVEAEGSPELLEVRKSDELDSQYANPERKSDRIVSFDWVTMGSRVLQPRILALRANGALDILEKPAFTNLYPFKLIPWKSPYRGLEENSPYHEVMQFDSAQGADVMGPLVVKDELGDALVFGPDKVDVSSIVQKASLSQLEDAEVVEDDSATKISLPTSFAEASTISGKLRILRDLVQKANGNGNAGNKESRPKSDTDTAPAVDPATHQGRHERLLMSTLTAQGLPREAQTILDHVTLFRAKERYLFDSENNRAVVADDPWLCDVWAWIGGADEATADGGMMSHPLDLSYMGVASIWNDDLGGEGSHRLTDESAQVVDVSVWERSISAICKKRGVPRFDGVTSRKPYHRQLCEDICRMGRNRSTEMAEFDKVPESARATTFHTMSAAHAMFQGDISLAVQRLKKASTEHPELLFVSLALQLISRGNRDLAKEQLDFDEDVASRTDPYLRAISSLIATGDWSTIANQKSLPLRERTFVAVRNLDDKQLTQWLKEQVEAAIETGDIEGIILTGITPQMADILAKYVEKFHDVQTATLIMSFCAPRYIDDYRCRAWRNAYRAYLQRHKAYFQRTKFEVESTKRSKRNGVPTIKLPFRQIALRCVYCDAETRLAGTSQFPLGSDKANQLSTKLVMAGVSCPNCRKHLPRCVVCLEIVGLPRSDKPESLADPEARLAARFPTFCLKCEHVLHLDHARQWFARHGECPVPECRCRCNFRANPELNYR